MFLNVQTNQAMGNEITVTRAKRFNLTKWAELPYGTYFLTSENQIMRREDGTSNSSVDASERIVGHMWDDGSMCVTLGSFDAMCKWVAANRKRDVFVGDGTDEWIYAETMGLQCFATATSKVLSMLIHEGDVLKRSDDHILNVTQGNIYALDLVDVAGMMVWPLKSGDSITIAPKLP